MEKIYNIKEINKMFDSEISEISEKELQVLKFVKDEINDFIFLQIDLNKEKILRKEEILNILEKNKIDILANEYRDYKSSIYFRKNYENGKNFCYQTIVGVLIKERLLSL